jgi:hypothetical protein
MVRAGLEALIARLARVATWTLDMRLAAVRADIGH